MNFLDIILIALLVLIVALAVVRIHKARKKGGMCSCCDQAGTCMKNRCETGRKETDRP